MVENAASPPEGVGIVGLGSPLTALFCEPLPADFGAQVIMGGPLGRGHPMLTVEDPGSGSFSIQNFTFRLSVPLDEIRRTAPTLGLQNKVAHSGLVELEKDGRIRLLEHGAA